MIVTQDKYDEIVSKLSTHQQLSLDTETYGLRAYHGDRLFSVAIGYMEMGEVKAYYFNFHPYPGLEESNVLKKSHLLGLSALLDDPERSWYIHNASFDLHMLAQEGLHVAGEVWCTLIQGRVTYNEHLSYSLSDSLKRIGLSKDDGVEKWITENDAWEWVDIPGKKSRFKKKYYDRVPVSIIVPYALADATGCYSLGDSQRDSIEHQSREYGEGMSTLRDASSIERRLSKTVFRMEREGVKIDRNYCLRAAQYEEGRLEAAKDEFKRLTGKTFSASNKLFQEVFSEHKHLWQYTEKNNPSFESDTLKSFKSPVAREVLKLRDAKSKLDFYHGFLWYADKDDVIHTNFKAAGTRTFRFSSSEPNLQNLTSEEASYCKQCDEWYEEFISECPECKTSQIEHPEFMVRRAIVPRPGNILIAPDFSQMEYVMMLDMAKDVSVRNFDISHRPYTEEYFEVANKVKAGHDVHQATAELMQVSRKYAKVLNFMLLYGGGAQKLADALGVTLDEAQVLKSKYFRVMPYVDYFIGSNTKCAIHREWVSNWAGYKYNFPGGEFSYTATNTIIQGGCAAVVKKAMNQIDEYLMGKKSKLVLTIHDELICEVHESEVGEVPKVVKDIMESAYPAKHIPLTVGMEFSTTSLADKKKGFPNGA